MNAIILMILKMIFGSIGNFIGDKKKEALSSQVEALKRSIENTKEAKEAEVEIKKRMESVKVNAGDDDLTGANSW